MNTAALHDASPASRTPAGKLAPIAGVGFPRRRLAAALAAAVLAGCSGGGGGERGAVETADPPEVSIGERLFLETRFAEHFATENGERVNAPLAHRDATLDVAATTGEPLPGPFRGGAMNCRACHLVDELGAEKNGGNRTYADFARRSPVPPRADARTTTPRNSPPLVNATLSRPVPFLLHFDGEFTSTVELVRATLTGRNFGWLPSEHGRAVAQVARVLRGDDGSGDLAGEFGGLPYHVLLTGTDDVIPPELRLPPKFRLDIAAAGDEQILDAVSALIAVYTESLIFAQDAEGRFSGSPYDRFLAKNGLPREPDPGESDRAYSRRLRGLLTGLGRPRFVSAADGRLETHAQDFVFDRRELRGLEIFLAEPAAIPPSADAVAQGGIGNCIACHAAPRFTDFRFHNTGAAQDEYDAVHGDGAFVALAIPSLDERNARPERFLPPSAAHPRAEGVFRAVPSADDVERTDLGLGNVFANDDVPLAQAAIRELLCEQPDPATQGCEPAVVLPRTVALFKTPGLRDLGHSGPYLHTGQKIPSATS